MRKKIRLSLLQEKANLFGEVLEGSITGRRKEDVERTEREEVERFLQRSPSWLHLANWDWFKEFQI